MFGQWSHTELGIGLSSSQVPKTRTKLSDENTRVQARQDEKNFDTTGMWNPKEEPQAMPGWQWDWQNSFCKHLRNTKTILQAAGTHPHPARRDRLSISILDRKAWYFNSHLEKSHRWGLEGEMQDCKLIKQSPLITRVKKQFVSNETLEKASRPKCNKHRCRENEINWKEWADRAKPAPSWGDQNSPNSQPEMPRRNRLCWFQWKTVKLKRKSKHNWSAQSINPHREGGWSKCLVNIISFLWLEKSLFAPWMRIVTGTLQPTIFWTVTTHWNFFSFAWTRAAACEQENPVLRYPCEMLKCEILKCEMFKCSL